MDKIPFNISASKQGTRALIRITGTIGWDTNAELFRSQVDGLVAQGAEDVHVYVNSPGGSCTDAAEIVNILTSSFKGKITGEGGALVASAATFIAIHCHSFEMPDNGIFMIHRPYLCGGGTVGEIEAQLKLLKVLDGQYLAAYKKKSTDTAELERQWETGDWWMSAQEALDAGFVTSVKAPIPIDGKAHAMIVACGCPTDKIPQSIIKTNEMELKETAKALGLPESATQAEVNARIAENRRELDSLKAERAREQQEARAAQIHNDVQAAVNDKRITADNVSMWEDALAADYEKNSKLLASLSPVQKIPVKPSAGSAAATGGKTFEQLQEENPEALAKMMAEDREGYDALYDDYLKRNKLQ